MPRAQAPDEREMRVQRPMSVSVARASLRVCVICLFALQEVIEKTKKKANFGDLTILM